MITKTGNTKDGYLLVHTRKGVNGKKIIENVKGHIDDTDCILNFSSANKIAKNTFECMYNEHPCIVFEEDSRAFVSMAYRKVDSSKGIYYLIFTIDDNKEIKPLVYHVVENTFTMIENAMRLLGSHVFADGILFTVDGKLNVSTYTLDLHQRKYVGNVAIIDASTYTGRRTYAIIRKESYLYALGATDIFYKNLSYDAGTGWILLSDDEGFNCIITNADGVISDKIIDVITECDVDGYDAKSKVLLCHDDTDNYWVWHGRCAKLSQPIYTKAGFMMLDNSKIKVLPQERVADLNEQFAKTISEKTIAKRQDLTSFASVRFSSTNGRLYAEGRTPEISVKESKLLVGGKEVHAGHREKKELVDVIQDVIGYNFVSGNTKSYPATITETNVQVSMKSGSVSRVIVKNCISSFFGEIKSTSRNHDASAFKAIDKNTFACIGKDVWNVFRMMNGAALMDSFGECPMTFITSPYAIGLVNDRFVLYKELFTDHMSTVTADLIKITNHGFALCNTKSGKCVMADNTGEIKEIKLAEWLGAQFYDMFDVKTWKDNYATMKNTYFVTKYDLEDLKKF